MDPRISEILERAKATAMNAATAAGKAADSAGKIAGDLFETTKINLQVFDLNTDIELLYKEIGKCVYLTHTGADVNADDITAKIAAIDEKFGRISELKELIAERKSVLRCEACGAECEKTAVFCSICGKPL